MIFLGDETVVFNSSLQRCNAIQRIEKSGSIQVLDTFLSISFRETLELTIKNKEITNESYKDYPFIISDFNFHAK